MKRKKQYWRVNEDIKAPEIRVIGVDGKQYGVISRFEALKLSRKEKTDLVEIAPHAKPPVVKLIDFGKFRYEQEKKEKDQKRKEKTHGIKEVRFSPFIADQDYETRKSRVSGFLKEGHKVRVVVVFKGRQMGSKPFGFKLIKRILGDLESEINVDSEPKFFGRHLGMVISPVSKRGKAKNEKNKTKNKEVSSKKI